MDDPSAELIAEKLMHTIDLLRNEIQAVKAELQHERELSNRRLAALEKQADDHEQRLRTVGDGVVTFKVWSGLFSGGSVITSIAALLKAFLP